MKLFGLLAALTLFACSVNAQSLGSARTQGLTSVLVEQSGDVFTWTVTNNTGPGDGEPLWDALIWTLQPVGLPSPVWVEAPIGWAWVVRGYSRFEIKSSNKKYESGPAIAPGASMVFRYKLASPAAMPDEPVFLAHVGAVLPESVQLGSVTRWTPAAVDGNPSWYDISSISTDTSAATPEPHGAAAMLAWAAGLIGLVAKRGVRS